MEKVFKDKRKLYNVSKKKLALKKNRGQVCFNILLPDF